MHLEIRIDYQSLAFSRSFLRWHNVVYRDLIGPVQGRGDKIATRYHLRSEGKFLRGKSADDVRKLNVFWYNFRVELLK